ncbi:MAG: hypothetical protein ACK5OX_09785 [Desertimonas sp.]
MTAGEERFRPPASPMDPAVRELGRRKVAELRRQLGVDRRHAPPPVESVDEGLSVDAMTAQMAAGAERERLERRVAELEAEVRRLRSIVSAAIGDLAAGLVTPESRPPTRL